jgi:hypothetical protein
MALKNPEGTDAIEKKLKRLMKKLEGEKQALNKILKSYGSQENHKQSNK